MNTTSSVDARLAVGALAALAAVDIAAPHLGDPGTNGQLVFLALVSLPLATLVVQAFRSAHPLGPRLLIGAAGAAAVAAALIRLGYPATPATLVKLVAATLIGITLAGVLKSTAEIVGIAVLVAAVDIYSVAAGPTHEIVAHHPGVLDDLALNLHPPGTYAVAQIGSSDFIFFALFAAATTRLSLRPWATWGAMTASFGVTFALADHFATALPALPLLSAAFLATNADRLWHGRRGTRDSPDRE